jgi:hypothetical protein
MNDQEKMQKILANKQVEAKINCTALYELMYGSLSVIGTAIAHGEIILLCGKESPPYCFSNAVRDYKIKQKTIMFNRHEINAPIEVREIGIDVVVYCACPTEVVHSHARYVKAYITAGVAFRTHADAEDYRRAAGWVK